MKKQVIFVILAAFLIAGMVSAAEKSAILEDNKESIEKLLAIDATGLTDQQIIDAQKQQIIDNLDKIKDAYNQNPPNLPSMAISMFSDATINIDMGGKDLSVVMKDAKIESISQGKNDKAGLQVIIKDKVFEEQNKGTFDPKTALKNKDITFSGIGFFNKIKFGSLGLIVKMIL
ncbi:hypothetical protein HZA98_03400 [Candidatus Woesearchaeota archaeon]|nr:hypothetical protein [Candidatus Woesearchaeota archaeon]